MDLPWSATLFAEADAAWYALPVVIVDYTLRIGLSLRVVMRRLPVGVALSWIMIVLIAPLAGAGHLPDVWRASVGPAARCLGGSDSRTLHEVDR
jgi:hypothetical protein